MNIYLIINHFNKNQNIKPFMYIGSDSKDRIKLSEYQGSSTSLAKDISNIGLEHFEKIILWDGKTDRKTLTEIESDYQKKYNAVESDEFYNKAYANGKFHTVGLANYYYLNDPDKKIVQLPTNHVDVLSGLAVGMNSGLKWSNAQKEKLINRTHPSELYDWSNHLSGHKKKSTKNYKKPKSKKHKDNMKKPKSTEHKKKLKESNVKLFGKKIEQYTLDGIFIQTFDTLGEAGDYIGGGNKRFNISACCRGLTKQSHGYIWKYAK